MRLDRALGENIRLALQVTVFIQDFQRTEQIVGAVIRERKAVGASVNKPVFVGKRIIKAVELLLRLLDGHIRNKTVHLLRNERLHAIPQLNHTLDAFFGGCVQVRFYHDTVFAVVNLAVHKRVAVILYIWVCGDGILDLIFCPEIRQLGCLIDAANVLYRLMELRGKVCALNGFYGKILLSVLRTFRSLPAKNHFRVANKVIVDGKSVRIFTELRPLRLCDAWLLSFLQEQNVRYHVRTGVGFERIVR